jgi:DNA polymerase-3 subunit gamma/tau
LPYISLYRKYRSQTFADLVGQDHVVKTLQNGITSGKIAHAYLFTGPRGTGKTSTARLLAKALCCEKGPAAEPCNECSICKAITDGSCMDVYEMDAASEAGVDEVREAIVHASEYVPSTARYRVFVIDEVHDLSPKAFDALLKTIEEPPEHVIFILATTEYHKVPPTIRSRCQKHEFHRASMTDLVTRLRHVADGEGVEIEPAALTAIARMADGGYRDALTIFEQVMVVSSGKVTAQGIYDQMGLIAEDMVDRVLVAMRESDVASLTTLVSEIGRMGRDPRSLLESMLYRLADMTRVAYRVETGGVADAAREAALHEICTRIGNAHLLRLRGALADSHRAIRDISLPRLWLEAELIRISQAINAAPATAQPVGTPISRSAQSAPPRQSAAAAATPPAGTPISGSAPSAAPPAGTPISRSAPSAELRQPEPEPEPTGDPVLDRARKAWAAAKLELSGMSKLMKVKLADTAAVEAAENKIVVEFKRQTELDWVADSPKRQAAVKDAIERHAGERWELELRAAKRNGPVQTDARTVELPSEGQKLVQMARDVFGTQQ